MMALDRDSMIRALSENPKLGKATKASIYLALQLMPAAAIAELGELIEQAANSLLNGDSDGFLRELAAAGIDAATLEQIRKSAEAARAGLAAAGQGNA